VTGKVLRCDPYQRCQVEWSGFVEVNGVATCGRIKEISGISACAIVGAAKSGTYSVSYWYETTPTGGTAVFPWAVCASVENLQQTEQCRPAKSYASLPPAAAGAIYQSTAYQGVMELVSEVERALP